MIRFQTRKFYYKTILSSDQIEILLMLENPRLVVYLSTLKMESILNYYLVLSNQSKTSLLNFWSIISPILLVYYICHHYHP